MAEAGIVNSLSVSLTPLSNLTPLKTDFQTGEAIHEKLLQAFPILKTELEEYFVGTPEQASKMLKIIEENCYTVDNNVNRSRESGLSLVARLVEINVGTALHFSNRDGQEGLIAGMETGGKTVLVTESGWRSLCRLSVRHKPNHVIRMGISYLLLPFGLSRFYLGYRWRGLPAFLTRFLGGIGIFGIIYDLFAMPSLVSESYELQEKLQLERNPKRGFLNKNQLKFLSGML